MLKGKNAVITGIVKATPGNEPLAGVNVSYGEYQTVTDNEGYYSLEVDVWDEKLTFTKKDYATWSRTVFCQSGETVTKNIMLPGEGIGTVTGTVIDYETGQPVSGVRVYYSYDL